MQTISSTLAATLLANETTATVRVLVDWSRDGSFSGLYEDLSVIVDDAGVERSVSTDLPDDARQLVGYSDGSATVTVSGRIDPLVAASDAVALMSPYSATLSSIARMGAPAMIDLAVTTPAGVEYLPLLQGRLTRIQVDADAGTATLQFIDPWENVTKAVNLPLVVGDDRKQKRPNLYAGWFMDWILRQNGYYATPAVRASCLVSATMHGSAAPEVGSLDLATVATVSTLSDGGALQLATARSGQQGLRFVGDTLSSFLTYEFAGGAGLPLLDTGSTLYVEAVVYVDSGNLTLAGMTAGGGTNITLGILGTSLFASITRSGGSASSVTLGSVSAGAWHYVALHLTMTATGADVRGRVDATTSATSIVASGASSGNGNIIAVSLGASVAATVEAYQLTTEPYSASMWNDAFTATAVMERSYNYLTATPSVDTLDSRTLIQQIAAAELGVATFDEAGRFRFYNRTHVATSALAATLTTTRDLASIGSTEALDSVRNVVTVGAQPLKLQTANSTIWSLSEPLSVGPLRTVRIPVTFDNPIYALQTNTVSYYSAIPYATGAGYKLTSGSGYRAARTADGTGTPVSDLTISATLTGPTTASLSIQNPHIYTVWLVNNTDHDPADDIDQGGDMLILRGQAIVPAGSDATSGESTAAVRNVASIAKFGEQTLEMGASPWRQAASTAADLARYLAYSLGTPQPVMDSVDVIATPHLQLADRVRITDAETPYAVNQDFSIAGYNLRIEGAGLAQSVDVRQAPTPLVWGGRWDFGSWQ